MSYYISEVKRERCRDFQEIKVQELIQNLGIGTVPRCVWVVLEDDLVDSCKPGDDVTICGIIMRRWKPMKIDVSVYSIFIIVTLNTVCPLSYVRQEQCQQFTNNSGLFFIVFKTINFIIN